MAIRIMTDSGADLDEEDARRNHIEVLPIHIMFGDEVFLSGVTITPAEFYAKMAQSSALPRTSMVTPQRYVESIRPYLQAGDDVIFITLSSKLSGGYESAFIAKRQLEEENLPGRFYVVDALTVTCGQCCLVLEAARARDGEMDAPNIVEHLEAIKTKLTLLAAVDTLRNLKQGGRLSSGSALIATVLNIKPLMSVVDGEVVAVGKERGQAKAQASIVERARQMKMDLTHPVVFAHAHCLDRVRELKEAFHAAFPAGGLLNAPVVEMGATVGTHAGEGAVAVSFFTV